MAEHDETEQHEYSEGHERAEHAALDHARSVLSAYREGVLFMDDQHAPIHFVADHGTGRLIASVPAATFFASHHAMYVPEETDDSLQLLLSCEEIEECFATDRWMAFHMGDSEFPEHTKWAAFWIDSAKHGPWVFDGEAFMAPNPVAELEPKACKKINSRRDDLARVTAELTGADATEGALCVGVDPGGLYVRLRHGVVRVPFPEPEEGEGSTIETLDTLVERLLAG